MRGSPLLRFILLALFLAVAALGVRRVTSATTAPAAIPRVSDAKPPADAPPVPFRLLLSAPASSVEIDTGAAIRPDTSRNPVSGTLVLDPANPHLSLIVRWQNPPAAGEHRFARLTLEAPGQPSVTHVFDADGDIDDFLELPLPSQP